MLNTPAEHTGGKPAVLELRFPARANSELIWAQRQAVSTHCELRCSVVRMEGHWPSCAMGKGVCINVVRDPELFILHLLVC